MNIADKTTTDEMLSSYLDGELDHQTVDELTARLAREPELMKRLEAMRAGDRATRKLLSQIDDLPLPDAVMALVEDSPASSEPNVVAFPARERPTFLQLPVAIAASLALIAGFLANGLLNETPATGLTMESMSAGTIANESPLNDFLEYSESGVHQQLAADIDAELVLSFQSESGRFCRQLRLDGAMASSHSVACRGEDGWSIEALAFTPASAGGQYQQASAGIPAAVDATVERLLGAGVPLSTNEENAAISNSWKEIRE